MKAMDIISLGMGRQSTALYILSSTGAIPRADHAIFADTRREGSDTYRFMQEHLLPWAGRNGGIPIHTVSGGDIMDSIGGESVSIPAFVHAPGGEGGMIRRQCTDRFKAQPVQRKVRELLGLPERGPFPPFNLWLGINVHERDRMNAPRLANAANVYPFLGYKATRDGFTPLGWRADYPNASLPALYALHGLPVPPRSSCVFCPYQSRAGWARRHRDPRDWESVLQADRLLEETPKASFQGQLYLFDKPVRARDYRPAAEGGDLFSTCEDGYCGV
jgi:hypothetical protein